MPNQRHNVLAHAFYGGVTSRNIATEQRKTAFREQFDKNVKQVSGFGSIYTLGVKMSSRQVKQGTV